MSEFDPEAVKRRGREKLIALRAAIREGLDSGPAEPLNMEAIIAEARANGLTDPETDAELQAWRKEPKV
jgi:hypothetical protein